MALDSTLDNTVGLPEIKNQSIRLSLHMQELLKAVDMNPEEFTTTS